MACLNSPLFLPEVCDEIDMANAAELTSRLDKLEERVANHIKFFWVALGAAILSVGGLALLILQTRSNVSGIATAQANAPAQIVTGLLNSPVSTQNDTEANLSAAASVLQTAKVGKVKPDAAKLRAISDKLIDDQRQYPEMPQVWATTGAFINYKFQALLATAVQVSASAAGKTCNLHVNLPGAIKYENCEVSLEDVASHFSNDTVNGEHVPIQFINCVVHYNGGGLPDAPMEFQNSILTFHVTVVPPRDAIDAMRQLAQAETFDRFKIKG